ncbi:helix-turn-helix domain-containing protein [Streptosporangium sp. NPDC049376]|uniref:helix-turn-helix domain-containing protein n=1 Tax=Streptosporangium sp. NPDC049376 TaxID=3366192 RepID=UPI0037B9EF0B
MTAVQRAKREQVRLRAAELFARGYTDKQVAKELRVSRMSANRWRRAWTCGGYAALAFKGPASLPRLSQARFARLEAAPLRGPAAHDWGDLNRHICPETRRFIADNDDWLRVFQLPSYAPDLNPVEGVWSC